MLQTFWHELVHYTQEKKLIEGCSKRGHMVYRQFIEAEAMSVTNLIAARCDFEKKLYEAMLEQYSDRGEAQKKYIGYSTRLRLYADRTLAKQEAQDIMGKNFDEDNWLDSENFVIKS